MLAKKMMKQEPPKARSTFLTTHDEVLEIATSVPADGRRDPRGLQREEVGVSSDTRGRYI